MTARCGRGHPRTWTAEEDVILLNSVRGTERKCWKQIALKFKDRTGKQCRQRYKYHLEQELKTGDWTPEEDEIIIQMQAKIGNCWSKISKALPGRSDNAVKNRWHCTLYRSEKKNKYFPNEHKQIELDPVLVEAIVEERITCDESWIDSKTETVSNACKESSRRRTPTAPWTPEEDQKLVSAVNKVVSQCLLVASFSRKKITPAMISLISFSFPVLAGNAKLDSCVQGFGWSTHRKTVSRKIQAALNGRHQNGRLDRRRRCNHFAGAS
mmetsp:Transcript_21847/g.59841  ORF Transcript_21847/g.59841 Transcript_21847/m.59841 type:complete len:268 (-) Transcript_21847:1355-2158(-)